ncbi:MAG: glycosyltransferase family 4 protein [Rhodobacteraceae bacterium]|nr:glycosyltransferase family 4 protein [Paracoccaceae bacterium]
MTRLLMIVPAPVNRLPDGRLRLDVKFVEGMRLHKALWQGDLAVLLWEGGQIPFGADYRPEDLGFEAITLDRGAALPMDLLAQFDAISASGDMAETLDLAGPGRTPVHYSIEYTLGTRLAIVALDRHLSLPRKVWSMIWNLRVERRRRAAFRRAAGVQANGYPAFHAYRALNPSTILYLDGRMRSSMMATPGEMAARANRALAGGGLRLVHSGRLEPMKGAQDLIPVARGLCAQGVDFTLDIFGTGSLEGEIRSGLAGMESRVRLHAPVDFETALVPWMRANADVFLSCHRQSDPSCTYLESMGCGVPVVGYDNAMWQGMQADSGAGWLVPLGKTAAMATEIARLAHSPAEVAQHAARALDFAQHHDFETEFSRRTRHSAARPWQARRGHDRTVP